MEGKEKKKKTQQCNLLKCALKSQKKKSLENLMEETVLITLVLQRQSQAASRNPCEKQTRIPG